MNLVGRIPLPSHPPDGEFDHAAGDAIGDRLFVAHPSNDAVEVVGLRSRQHLRTLRGLRGVAGVWVDSAARFLFTSNRGEDTASIFRLDDQGESELFRVPTGARPNGLAFDPERRILLVAGVGNAKELGAPPTLTFVDVVSGRRLGQVVTPGRTRWALYHRESDRFYVNVADPRSILVVQGHGGPEIAGSISVTCTGPHGLEQDPDGRTLYCACDDGNLVAIDVSSQTTIESGRLAGAPDVLWLNRRLGHLYVAIGEPGVVQVFRTHPLEPLESIPTELGAHTLTVDVTTDDVHVFLPKSHADLIFHDVGGD